MGNNNNNNLKSYLLQHLSPTSFTLIFSPAVNSLVSTELPLIYTGASKTSTIPLKHHILQLFTQRKGTDRD